MAAPASSPLTSQRRFRAVVSTLVPETAELEEAGWRELEALVESSLTSRPRTLRQQLRLFLHLVQWLPLFRYGRPFTALSPARRARFLASLQEHSIGLIRIGFWGLRALAFLGYYGRDAAARAIGYRPDPRGWEAAR
ncbi:MAG: hypothetical protein JSV41_03555 [Gemmatimonadota bacterium]|nr:MAG: hypothetical protein JSV41_03555 [Gemmatimonadota bacterium]